VYCSALQCIALQCRHTGMYAHTSGQKELEKLGVRVLNFQSFEVCGSLLQCIAVWTLLHTYPGYAHIYVGVQALDVQYVAVCGSVLQRAHLHTYLEICVYVKIHICIYVYIHNIHICVYIQISPSTSISSYICKTSLPPLSLAARIMFYDFFIILF
jgi:hypothetical protein